MTSKRLNLVLLAGALLCSAFLLSACNRSKSKKFIDQDTYNLMKQTEAELSICAERCRDAARGGHSDSYVLLALANSQEILAQRHVTLLAAARKKYKLAAYTGTVEPSETRVLSVPEEYEHYLQRPNNSTLPREVLITLEITDKVLKQDTWLENTLNLSRHPIEDLHICTVCGCLVEGEVENCPVCNSSDERIIKLESTGELPAPEAGSYVVRKRN